MTIRLPGFLSVIHQKIVSLMFYSLAIRLNMRTPYPIAGMHWDSRVNMNLINNIFLFSDGKQLKVSTFIHPTSTRRKFHMTSSKKDIFKKVKICLRFSKLKSRKLRTEKECSLFQLAPHLQLVLSVHKLEVKVGSVVPSSVEFSMKSSRASR